jgi:hypothetical protein
MRRSASVHLATTQEKYQLLAAKEYSPFMSAVVGKAFSRHCLTQSTAPSYRDSQSSTSSMKTALSLPQ